MILPPPPPPPPSLKSWRLLFILLICHGNICSNVGLIIARHKKCVTSSCNFLNNNLSLPEYAENPSSTRATADQRRRYLRGGVAWIQEVTFSSKAYGKSILTQLLTSYLVMMMHVPTSMNQSIKSWIYGRRKIRTSTVSTSTRNGLFYPCSLSVDGIIGKEALVIPSNLSWLMAEKPEETISYVCGWVNGWIEIMAMISYYRMICGARLPSPLWDQKPYWDYIAGLGLAQ